MTVWTNKKANQSNMKDINNIIVDEVWGKCGEVEDAGDHMISKCRYILKKQLVLLPTTCKQSTKTTTHQGTIKKSRSRLWTESWNPYNYNNLQKYHIYNIPLKNTSKAHKKQIESIIYQIRAKIYSTRNNESEIEYDEARVGLHLLNDVEELENVKMRELQEPWNQYLFVIKTQLILIVDIYVCTNVKLFARARELELES